MKTIVEKSVARLSKDATNLVNRATALGLVSKTGASLTNSIAFELIAAQKGFRTHHAHLAALKQQDTVNHEAVLAWHALSSKQGWEDAEAIQLLMSFISTKGLAAELLAFSQNFAEVQDSQAFTETKGNEPTATELMEQWGYEHLSHPREDWRYACENGDTCLGYFEWVASEIRSNGGLQRYCSHCGAYDCTLNKHQLCEACSKDAYLMTRAGITVDATSSSAFHQSIWRLTTLELRKFTDDLGEKSEGFNRNQLIWNLRHWYHLQLVAVADSAFQAYDFEKEGWVVEDHQGWQSDSCDDYSKRVYLDSTTVAQETTTVKQFNVAVHKMKAVSAWLN